MHHRDRVVGVVREVVVAHPVQTAAAMDEGARDDVLHTALAVVALGGAVEVRQDDLVLVHAVDLDVTVPTVARSNKKK